MLGLPGQQGRQLWQERLQAEGRGRAGAERYRIYGRSDVNRLAFVKRSRDLGFTIDEVRVLLALAREGDRDCKEVDAIASDEAASGTRRNSRTATSVCSPARSLPNDGGGRLSVCTE